MFKKMKRKTLLLVAVEIVALVVMALFLNAMQGNLSLKGYRNDIGEEMNQVKALLQEADEEEGQTKENFDAIYQSKAASVGFMAQNDVDFAATDAKMQEYKSLLDVDNVLVVGKDGKVVAQAQNTPADFSRQRYNRLRQVFSNGKPSDAVEVDQKDGKRFRYYAAKIDDSQMVVVEQNPEELTQLLEDTTSLKAVFSNITIGQTGYVFAVSAQDYLVDYHPNEDYVGTDALDAGISVSDLEDNNFTWINFNGQKLYAGISKVDNTYYISAVPEAEIQSSRNITVGAILFAFFAVITIVITYGVFIMKDDEKRPVKPENYKEAGGFIYNKYIGRKASVLSLVGLICILIISYYMQTLFALSSQSMTNAQRVTEVEETIDRYQDKIDTLTEQYNARYLSKAKTVAYIIDRKPELKNKSSLQSLADVLQIQYVYVFDANGVQTATNSPYTKFQISQDPKDQSYDFNKLLSGAEYLIQDVRPDDVSGETRQYIGVSLRDAAGNADGFVQIGVRPSRLEKLMENVQLDNVLDGVKVGVHGFAFAVNKESHNFDYYPTAKMVGRAAAESGIADDMLVDGYSGYMTIDGQKYYANGVETADDYVYVAVPESEIMEERVPLTLAAAGVSLICLAVTFLILTLTPKRDGKEASTADEPEGDSRMIDVTMPDGRVAKTEAASSRWMNIAMKWDEKTPEQKIAGVVKGIFGCLAIIICLVVLFQSM